MGRRVLERLQSTSLAQVNGYVLLRFTQLGDRSYGQISNWTNRWYDFDTILRAIVRLHRLDSHIDVQRPGGSPCGFLRGERRPGRDDTIGTDRPSTRFRCRPGDGLARARPFARWRRLR